MAYWISEDDAAITCTGCGRTSHNVHDVQHRYCANCRVFHDEPGEFDCSDCGRHIVVVCGPVTGTCAACSVVPGWYRDPEIARVIDPSGLARPGLLQ